MKNLAWGVAVVGLMLAGCPNNMRPVEGSGFDPHKPTVRVAPGGVVVVDQEPIVIPRNEPDALIVWQLLGDPDFAFGDDGITVNDPNDEFRCRVREQRRQFECKFKNSRPGVYKYTIRVNQGLSKLDPLDPHIRN